MRSSRCLAGVGSALLMAVVLAGCAGTVPSTFASPLAGCPITEAEVEGAIGLDVESPHVGEQYKTMIESCSFGFGPLTNASIQFLVFDAEAEGMLPWDSARADYPGSVDVPGVGDGAFATASPRATDLFAVKGDRILHLSVYKHDPMAVEQLAALARAALARL